MTKAFFSSIVIHVSLLFALIVFLSENTPKISIKQTKKISLKHIVLKEIKPKEEPPKKTKSEEKKKEIETQEKPIKRPKPKPIKKLIKKLKPKVKKRTLIKHKAKKIIKKRTKTKKHIVKKHTKHHKKSNITKEMPTMPIQAPRQEYFVINKNKIYEAIQRAKRYPRLAKKLHIQGIVHVRFTLHPNGEVTNIQTSNAHAILKKSARQTIIEASPEFPKTTHKVDISLNIAYKLR